MLSVHVSLLVLVFALCAEVGIGYSLSDDPSHRQQELNKTKDCKTENEQPQNRSVSFERSQNSFAVSISCCDGVTQVVSYPIPVVVSFSIPISLPSFSAFEFVNCYPLNTTMLTPTSYTVVVVPLRHGVFSISLPANALTVDSLQNEAASLLRIYVGGVLESSLHSIGWKWAILHVSYDYSAVVHCMVGESDTPPDSCQDIQLSPTHSNVTVTPGVSSLLSLQGLSLNHTYYAFCCAEEPLGVLMQSSIADTRVAIAVGWLDCPLFRGVPCSGHGQCMDMGWCQCDPGYYGSFCNKACEGLIEGEEVKECNGRGKCRREGYQCECDDPLFSGAGCTLSLLEVDSPDENHGFVYWRVESGGEDEERLRVGLVHSISLVANVSALAIGLREFDDSGDFLYLFYVYCEVSRLDSVLRSLSAGDVRQRIVAVLTQQGVPFDHLSVGSPFSVTVDSDPYWCYDGVRDEDETDVDCGGDTCSKRCGLGDGCLWDRDCQRGACVVRECTLSTGLNGWSIVLIVVFVLVVVLGVGIVVWGQRQLKEARKKELPIVSAPLPERMNSLTYATRTTSLTHTTRSASISYATRSTSATNATESRDVFPDDQTTVTTSETELERELKEKARMERAFTRKHKTVASDASLSHDSIHHTMSSDKRRHSQSLSEMGVPQHPPVALFHSEYHLVNDSN